MTLRAFALAGAAGLGLAGAAAADPPSYTLLCRGGPSMTLNMAHDVFAGGALGRSQLAIDFQRAPQGADSAAPGPGQCAWRDRPLNNAEPTSLFQYAEGTEASIRFGGDGRISTDSRGYRLAAEGREPAASDWTYLMSQILNGTPFSVEAYNAGAGLAITRVNR